MSGDEDFCTAEQAQFPFCRKAGGPGQGKCYRTEFNQVTRRQWADLLRMFADASIIQCWDFAGTVGQGQHTHRLVLSDQSRVVGLAQIRTVVLPLLDKGIAYVTHGPLWRRKGKEADLQVFEALLTALQDEYVEKRQSGPECFRVLRRPAGAHSEPVGVFP